MSWMIERKDGKCCILAMTCLCNLELTTSAACTGPGQN